MSKELQVIEQREVDFYGDDLTAEPDFSELLKQVTPAVWFQNLTDKEVPF